MSLNLSFFILCRDNNTDFIRVVVRIKLCRVLLESLAMVIIIMIIRIMVIIRIITLQNIILCHSGLGVRMLEF